MADDAPPTTPPVAPGLGLASDREIMRQAVEQLRDDLAAMRRSQKPPLEGWHALAHEWTKPAGLIPLVVLIFSCAVGGLALKGAVERNTEINAAQQEALAPLPRLIERLADRADAAEARQREELLAWREWRKNVDESIRDARDNVLDVTANRTRIDALEKAIQEQNKELSQKLERILIEQAEVKTRLEARGRKPDDAPFDRNQTWRSPAFPFSPRPTDPRRAADRTLRGASG